MWLGAPCWACRDGTAGRGMYSEPILSPLSDTGKVKQAPTYDAAGNMTGDGTGTGTHTYAWDAEGRLKSVDGGATATFTYNALGQRAVKA